MNIYPSYIVCCYISESAVFQQELLPAAFLKGKERGEINWKKKKWNRMKQNIWNRKMLELNDFMTFLRPARYLLARNVMLGYKQPKQPQGKYETTGKDGPIVRTRKAMKKRPRSPLQRKEQHPQNTRTNIYCVSHDVLSPLTREGSAVRPSKPHHPLLQTKESSALPSLDWCCGV